MVQGIKLDCNFADRPTDIPGMLLKRGLNREVILWYADPTVQDADAVDANLNLGQAHLALGDAEKAASSFARAIQDAPDNAEAYYKLGMALCLAGRHDEAESSCRKAVTLRPADPDYLAGLAHALMVKGGPDEAQTFYRRAVHLDPNMPGRLDREAWRFATHPGEQFRNGALAVFFATLACEASQGKVARFLDTLAAAYAEAGQFDRALETAGKALNLLGPDLAVPKAAVQSRVRLYESHQPFRETEFGTNDRLWREVSRGR
jgi:tetratricopeptide (TPR) repeat protein